MSERDARALSSVKKHAAIAGAAGFVPVPLFDIAAVTAVQLKMLSGLAKEYGVPFQRDRGKAIISSLLAGVVTPGLGVALGSLIKIIPVVGSIIGSVSVPIFASAATYAVGKVFTQHFASGGTFLDFDPESVRDHFQAEFEAQAKNEAKTANPAA